MIKKGSLESCLRVFLALLVVQAALQGVRALDYSIVHRDNSLIQAYKVLQLGSGIVAHHFVKVNGVNESSTYELSQVVTEVSGKLISESDSITVNSAPITFLSFLFDGTIGIIYYNDLNELKMKLFDLSGNFLRLVSFNIPFLGESVKLEGALNGIAANDTNSFDLVFLRQSQNENGLMRLKYSLDGNLLETDTLVVGSTQILNLTTLQNSRGQNTILWTQKKPNSTSLSIFVYNANSSLSKTQALIQPKHYVPTNFMDAYFLQNGGLITLTAVTHPKGGFVTYVTFYNGYLSLASSVEINHIESQEKCNLIIFNSDKSGVLCSAPGQFPSEITIFSASNYEVTVENVEDSFGLTSFQQKNGFVLSSQDDTGILAYSFFAEIRISVLNCCPMQFTSTDANGDFLIARVENNDKNLLKKLEVPVADGLDSQLVNIYLGDTAKVYAGIIPIISWVETDDVCGFLKQRSSQNSDSRLNLSQSMMFHYEDSMSGYPGFMSFSKLRPNASYALIVCAMKNNRETSIENMMLNFKTPYTGYRLEKVKLSLNYDLPANDLQKWLCSLHKSLGLSEQDTSISVEGYYCQGKTIDNSINPSKNQTITLLIQGNSSARADNTTDIQLYKIFQQNALRVSSLITSKNQVLKVNGYEYLGAIKDNIPDLLPIRVDYNVENQNYEFKFIVSGTSGYLYGILVEQTLPDDPEICSNDLVAAFYQPEVSRFATKKVTRFSYMDGEKTTLLLPAKKPEHNSYFYYTATNENPSVFSSKTPIQHVVLKSKTSSENKNTTDKSIGVGYITLLVVLAVIFCFILMFCIARRFMENENERPGDFDDLVEIDTDEETFEQTKPIEVGETPKESKKDSRIFMGKSNLPSNKWKDTGIQKDTHSRQEPKQQEFELGSRSKRRQGSDSAGVMIKKEIGKAEEEKEDTLDPADIDPVPKSWRDRGGYQVFNRKANEEQDKPSEI